MAAQGEVRAGEPVLHTYEAVTNSITDMISVANQDWVYRLVNDAWCRGTGLTREQAIGNAVFDVLPVCDTEPRRQALQECLQQQEIRQVRGTLSLPGVVGRHLETTFYPYVEAGQEGRFVVMITRDVTEQEDARTALAVSADVLRRTLNATDDAIFASDAVHPHQPVRFANHQMYRMWGIPETPAQALTPAQIIEHARPLFIDPEAEVQRIQQIIASNASAQDRLVLRDGRVLMRRCIAAGDGASTVRVWSFRDITAQEFAMQAVLDGQADQRALLDAYPGYIAAMDQDLHYTYVNHRLAGVLGRSAQQMVGRHASEVLSAERFALNQLEIAAALAHGRSVCERSYPATAEHKHLDLEVWHVAGPPREGGARTIYVFGIDITERKLAEHAAIAARDDAERANRAKSRFLSQMSHELRTPMNAILGFGQLLQSDTRNPLQGEQRHYAQQILRGGRHLLDLINDVLDLGRIESGGLAIDSVAVDLLPVVEECFGLIRPLADKRSIQLQALPRASLACLVMADHTRLKQVLFNLLANAIKYNRQGGSVAITCDLDVNTVRITVHDTGHGLDTAQQQRLFKAFERLGASASAVEGTGIGLALSRHLVHAMQGEIGVESELGRGSRFWIQLSRAQAGSAVAPAAADMSRPKARKSAPDREVVVLYVEDNRVNILLMEAMLARLPKLRLLHSEHPMQGLEMARAQRPDLVLLDIQMPDMDGFELLRELRADPRTRDIPAIAVSASAMPADVKAGLAAGFAAYLTKPLDIVVLLAAVQRVLVAAPKRPAG